MILCGTLICLYLYTFNILSSSQFNISPVIYIYIYLRWSVYICAHFIYYILDAVDLTMNLTYQESYRGNATLTSTGAAKIRIDHIDHFNHCIARINLSPEPNKFKND